MNRSYSFHDIARRSGLSPSGVNRIFNGNRVPRLSTLTRLAEAEQVSIADLCYALGVQIIDGRRDEHMNSGSEV